MEALISSTAAVAIAEIGDKTQLLALVLAGRFRQRWAIVWGILVATLVNHGVSAWLGTWLAELIPADAVRWIIGGSFLLVALWVLVPDKDQDTDGTARYGAFLTTLVLFFLAEIGDKTQVATVLLGAHYQSPIWVTLGSTLGMLAANVPVVWAGQWLLQKFPLQYARWGAFALFAAMGLMTLIRF